MAGPKSLPVFRAATTECCTKVIRTKLKFCALTSDGATRIRLFKAKERRCGAGHSEKSKASVYRVE